MTAAGLAEYLQFFLALAFVLGLIVLMAWLMRRLGGARYVGQPGRRRLAIVEMAPLDGRRRLVLVRRDDKEHLLLLGAQDDVVVETGIDAPPAPPAANGPPARPPFAQIMDRIARPRAGPKGAGEAP